MPDHDLDALAREQLPHARRVVQTATAALHLGDRDACELAIRGYLAPTAPTELAARISAYVHAALEACAQRVRQAVESRPRCGHPGCGPAFAGLDPDVRSSPAEYAVSLAITELANGDRAAARDALSAFSPAATQGPHDVAGIPVATTRILMELYGGAPIEHVDVYVGYVGQQRRGDHDND